MNNETPASMPSNLHFAQLVEAAVECSSAGESSSSVDLLAILPTKSLREMNEACLADMIVDSFPARASARDEENRPAKRPRPSLDGSSAHPSPSEASPRDDEPYDEGLRLHTASVPVSDANLQEPRSLAAVLYNLALANVRQRQDSTALRLFELAHDVCKSAMIDDLQVQDGSSTSTSGAVDELSLLHNIGVLHHRRREYSRALESFARTEVLALVRHGSTHLSVATALNCLGVVLFHSMDANDEAAREAAMDHLREALSIQTRILGEEHKDVGTTLNNLGRVCFDAGEYAQALKYHQQALKIRRAILGAQHVDVAAAAFNAGQACHKLGDLRPSLELYGEYQAITRRTFGPHHAGAVTVAKYLGQVHHELGHAAEATRQYREALKTSREVMGRYNREAASILNLLGNLHYESGDFDDAIEVYEQGLAIERTVLHRHCNNIVVTLSNIGQALMQKGDYASALAKYKEVHFLQTLQSAPHPRKVSETLSIIGQIHTLLGMYSQAERAFLKVISISKDAAASSSLSSRSNAGGDPAKEHGSMDVALALNYLGFVYFKQGALTSAMEKFQESLAVRLRAPTTSGDVAVLLYNIASIYLHQGDNDAALAHYQRALEVEREALGSYHPDVATTLKLIGKVHDRCGRYDEAIAHYDEAVTVYRRCIEDYDDSTLADEPSSPEGRSEDDVRELKKNAARVLALLAGVYLKQAHTEAMTRALAEAHRLFVEVGAPLRELELDAGFELYELSILHPECAAAA